MKRPLQAKEDTARLKGHVMILDAEGHPLFEVPEYLADELIGLVNSAPDYEPDWMKTELNEIVEATNNAKYITRIEVDENGNEIYHEATQSNFHEHLTTFTEDDLNEALNNLNNEGE